MKRLLFTFLLAFIFAGCTVESSVPDQQENVATVDLQYLKGNWSEDYDDPYFAFDSSVSYIITDNTITIISYNLLGDGSEAPDQQVYEYKLIDNTIEYGVEKYTIYSLTENEMEWIRKGLDKPNNDYGSAYLHFVRNR